MSRTKNVFLVAVVALLLLIAAFIWSVSYIKNTANSYLYGYPLVLMGLTRQVMTESEDAGVVNTNRFSHIKVFPDHTTRNVVRPNNDTLYSIAWLDLSKSPLISVSYTHLTLPTIYSV